MFYQILQTTIYQFFSVMNKNSLSELSKKYNILLLRNNYLPNESFLKKKFMVLIKMISFYAVLPIFFQKMILELEILF